MRSQNGYFRRAATAGLRVLHRVLQPLDIPGCCAGNCNVNLDNLGLDRPDLDGEPQRARGNVRNLQLHETKVSCSG
jgi:hypothetical protein